MNNFGRLIACSVLVTAPVLAFAQGNSEQKPRGGLMQHEQMQQMQESMARMQGMMQEMRNARSDAERQEIRERHMESMQNHMGMMREGMMDQGTMAGGQGMMNQRGQSARQSGSGQGNRTGTGTAGMDNEQRLDFLESRMNQIQLMMEQMLEHQSQQNRN